MLRLRTNHEFENALVAKLKELMFATDLDNITSKQVSLCLGDNLTFRCARDWKNTSAAFANTKLSSTLKSVFWVVLI
jgi:hypothetical protein